MSKIFRYLVVSLSLVLLASCGSKKDVVSQGDYEDGMGSSVEGVKYNVNTVAESKYEWTDVTISGSLSVGAANAGTLSSAMVMKMVKGKSISISIRPILGIEMGKIYFADDTVTVVDKYHKAYLKEPIGSFLGSYIDIPTLQSLFLSRPFVIGKGEVDRSNRKDMKGSENKENGEWVLSPAKQNDYFAYNFDMSGNNIKHFNVIVGSPSLSGTYAMNFGGYKLTAKGIVATLIDAQIPVSGTTASFKLQYGKSITWDGGISDGINIPSGATHYDFADILKMVASVKM